jgi:hypothetical protein
MSRAGVSSFTLGLALVLFGQSAWAQPPVTSVFYLSPNPKFIACLEDKGGKGGSPAPYAQVTVTQNELNDDLAILVRNVKPNLGFDLFTIQNTNLLSNGTVDPNFKTFGLAWYQSDIQADSFGNALTVIRSIFVNQIFGFDAGTTPPLPPTHTFHVGFWFNNPNDAKPCGFTGSTPFNGEQDAGPNAMISVPSATTGLGPLCLNPNTSTHPATCNE